jgi:hypothetical protein
MLTFTKEARDFALQKGKILHLQYFSLNACCIPYQPGPSICFGLPHNPQHYQQKTIEDLQVLIPNEMPDVPLEIHLSTFLGIKRLVVEGWRHA